jgi:hypothetical protein
VVFSQRIPGQEGSEVFGNADRADSRAAAAVRNAEGFVEIQMADIRPEIARAAKTDLGVHVRTVHINLTASGMGDVANLADSLFENTVRGGVCNHHASEGVAVGVGFDTEIGEVDVSRLVAGDRNDSHPCHDGAGWVRAVRGDGDEAIGALVFTA